MQICEVLFILLPRFVWENQRNNSNVFPQHCIWVNTSFFHYIKIQIGLLAKINVVNNALVLTSKDHVCSEVKSLISHTWEVILIHRLHVQYIFKEPQLCIFMTDIDYFIQLTYISLCTHLKCLWLPYKKKCKNCPQHLTSSRLQHSAISATVFN